MKCQVVFRTKRGGTGLEYSVVRDEFLAVFEPFIVEIYHEAPGRFRLWVVIDLPPHQIAQCAAHLGYTQGILLVHEEVFDGASLDAQAQGRWRIGWLRRDQKKVFQEELYVQDELAWFEQSPHRRHLKVRYEGEILERVGHHHHRGLSPLDAKFLLNVTPLFPGARVLDPFAGFGGLVLEGQRRLLQMVASDWEPQLAPGLDEMCQGSYAIADARRLPFQSGVFDAVVTEPPFSSKCRSAVLEALPEIHRMTPRGPVTLFVAEDMHEAVLRGFEALGRRPSAEHWLRRNRGLRCVALCFR